MRARVDRRVLKLTPFTRTEPTSATDTICQNITRHSRAPARRDARVVIDHSAAHRLHSTTRRSSCIPARMIADRPSRTAVVVSFARALATIDRGAPGEGLDPFARLLLPRPVR